MNKIKDLPNEIWKDVDGFDGQYQISNMGRVKSLKFGKERIKKLHHNQITGYVQTVFSKESKLHNFLVHRLVCDYFVPNPNELNRVNHKDLDKTNNTAENLEWCTQQENIHHYYNSDAKKKPREMRTILAWDIPTGKFLGEFPSISHAARELKCGPETPWRQLTGLIKNPRRYKFEYKDDE